MNDRAQTLLIYAPVPVFRSGGELFVEAQACNGLRLWAENFDRVIAMMPEEHGPPPVGWRPASEIGENLERIGIEPLPTAYRPDQFLLALPRARRKIRSLIDRADYLSFAIGGLFGDWGAVSCQLAHRMGRGYAVWTDRVESQVLRSDMSAPQLWTRLKARAYWRPMAALERFVIRRAKVGLFHGQSTFDTYAPFCRDPVLVHDIHISKDDHIPAAELRAKVMHSADEELRIAYVGRADPMKGPMDWLAVAASLAEHGVDFHATWLGDGSELVAMREFVDANALGDRVSLPGYTEDRQQVLGLLRDAHVFLFTHKTPESPRCLIEALISGCPILGYTSPYAAELIAGNRGGTLGGLNDTDALVRELIALSGDRARLGRLIGRAARDGARFDDVSVFRHRSEVIKSRLGR